MSPYLAASIGAGALLAAGLVALVLAVVSERPARVPIPTRMSGSDTMRLAAAVAAGGLCWLVTGWPAAAIAVAALVVGGPALFAKRGTTQVDKVEGIAVFAESLRDTLSASRGISEAIGIAARHAPRAIRPAASRLAADLASGIAAKEALGVFADTMADPSADLVASALTMAMTRRAANLADLLGELAETARAEVAMRLRVEAARAPSRSAVRLVAGFSIGFAAALALLAHSYLAPYGSAAGQVALGVVAALYGFGFWLMVRMCRTAGEARLFGDER